MSGISGYPSQEKLTNQLPGYDDLNSKTSSQFVTVSQTHDKHVVQDVRINGAFRTTALVKTLTSIATDFPLRVLVSTGHGAQKGDFVRFEGTAANPHFAAMIIDTPDANTMIIGATLPVTPVLGDEFFVLRHVVPLYDEDGTLSVSSGPIQFIRDGLNQQVIEDTITPANNVPLPVKLTSVTGDINITAGDLNVQLSDTGANPDITRIGDGTNRLVMTAAGEATTFDATTNTALTAVNAELDSQTALLTTIDADTGGILTQTTNINTELDAQTALLTTIDADTGAIATSAASIDGKLPATLGTKTAATSLAVTLSSDGAVPLPTGAATEATLAALAAEDFATQATQALVLAEVSGINAKTNSNFGASTGAIRAASQIGNATGAADFGAGNVSAQTLRTVLASDYVPLATAGRAVVTTTRNDYSSVNVTTGAWTQLIASTASAINEIEIFDSSGQTMELGIGGAGSETRLIYIFPGGNGRILATINSGTRVSVRAVSATANVGELTINYYA